MQTVLHTWRALRQAAALRLSPEFRKSHVIHANTTRAGLYGSIACLGSGRPFVVHLRDMVTPESLGKVGAWIYSRVVLPKANAVISNSESTLATAKPFIRSRTLVEVIPSPTGMTRPTFPVQTAKSVSRIGMVARIDPWKGQDMLIRAFANVYKDQNVKLVLAGSPAFGHEDYWDDLHLLAGRLGVADQVQFLGHVEDVGALLHSLDVCVQASIRPEPLGQNVLQYLYCGRPTIAANDGGPREWIEDGQTGLLFRTGDICSLENALRVIRDPDVRRELTTNALRRSNVPSDQEISDRHANVFISVVGRQYNSNSGRDSR
ncbi:glycosyltransferase [Kocuria nitroreducens]|uniref:glycosyltransferase n=1 Tax=Kocuria nitroreducens TaxID=3058914 RepID=UPI0036DF09CA